MDFSVVIPAYNAAAWIDACIESVLAQSGDFEVLIVDDGSTDVTFDIAAHYEHSHPSVRALKTPRNSGPGAARNVGLNVARGDWVLFLDSDDSLAPNAFDALRAVIDQAPDDLDLAAYDWRYEHGGGGRKDLASLRKPKADRIRDALALKMDGSVIFTAMRREMIDAWGAALRRRRA